MQQLVRRKLGSGADTTVYIPNWADLDLVYPLPKYENELLLQHQLTEKFVVQYAGNMGRPNAIELLLETALSLEAQSDIHFLCIGAGAKRRWLEQQIAFHRLKNVTVLESRPAAHRPIVVFKRV